MGHVLPAGNRYGHPLEEGNGGEPTCVPPYELALRKERTALWLRTVPGYPESRLRSLCGARVVLSGTYQNTKCTQGRVPRAWHHVHDNTSPDLGSCLQDTCCSVPQGRLALWRLLRALAFDRGKGKTFCKLDCFSHTPLKTRNRTEETHGGSEEINHQPPVDVGPLPTSRSHVHSSR